MLAKAALLLTALFASEARAAAVPPDSLAVRVDELITARYFLGLPYDKVRALGPKAIPILHSRLRDPKYRVFLPEVCQAICMMGAPESYPILRSFIWDSGTSAVSRSDNPRPCLGEMVAQSGLGLIAKNSDEALEYLLQSTNPAYWDSLPYRCDRDIPRDFVEASINTLALTERTEARPRLVKLAEADQPDFIRAAARRAIGQFDEIKKLGYEEYERQLLKRIYEEWPD